MCSNLLIRSEIALESLIVNKLMVVNFQELKLMNQTKNSKFFIQTEHLSQDLSPVNSEVDIQLIREYVLFVNIPINQQ